MYYGLNYNPWNRLLRELNAVRDAECAPSNTAPKVNAYSNDDGVVLTAELPGVAPDDLQITVQENVVTIAGKYPERQRKDGETYHRSERPTGAFSREFRLPYRIDGNRVSATAQNGLLTLELRRLEEDKPRAIPVKVA